MKSSRVIAVFAACVIIAITLISPSRRLFAQGSQATQPSSNQVYNPYPPGILPSNLNAELMRVETEVDFVEARAMARWKALKLPTISNNPPVLEDTGTEAIETLGELMNFDRTISPKKTQPARRAICLMSLLAARFHR